MSFSGLKRWWHERKEVWDDNRIRRLQSQSKHPKGEGWFFDQNDPNRLYVLGYSLQLDRPWTPGYKLEGLENLYRQLKQELAERYPNFNLSGVLLEVEVAYAAALLRDDQIRNSLRPRVCEFRDLYNGLVSRGAEVHQLEGELVLDGDTIEFRLVQGGYYQEYGFFVYGHPESPLTEGWWCRPSPDPLAMAAGESTL